MKKITGERRISGMNRNRRNVSNAGLSNTAQPRHRIDDAVYLNESRYERPKEIFRVFREILKSRRLRPNASLLDAGCATGELIYYLQRSFGGFSRYEGIDISPTMIARAKRNVPCSDFKIGSVLTERLFRNRRYDTVILSGVLQIFDDPTKALRNMLSCANKGATIIVSGPFNNDPVDVFMRYRRSSKPGAQIESGWNLFSCQTIERTLNSMGYRLRIRWENFRMPYAIKKRSNDPMRTWTMKTEENKYQLVNGASQLVNMKIVIIDVLGLPSGRR